MLEQLTATAKLYPGSGLAGAIANIARAQMQLAARGENTFCGRFAPVTLLESVPDCFQIEFCHGLLAEELDCLMEDEETSPHRSDEGILAESEEATAIYDVRPT